VLRATQSAGFQAVGYIRHRLKPAKTKPLATTRTPITMSVTRSALFVALFPLMIINAKHPFPIWKWVLNDRLISGSLSRADFLAAHRCTEQRSDDADVEQPG